MTDDLDARIRRVCAEMLLPIAQASSTEYNSLEGEDHTRVWCEMLTEIATAPAEASSDAMTENTGANERAKVEKLRHMLKRMRQSIMLWGSMSSMREGRDLGWRDDIAEIDRVLKETADNDPTSPS